MKFKILLLVGLMCIGLKSQAQEEFRFGITANPGVVWVKPDNQNISSNGVRFGFDFGLVVDYIFGQQDRYSFNSGVNLLISGARLKGTAIDSSGLTSDLTARINYLEIPLTIKLRSNEVGYLTYYGQLGFTPQFAVRSRADYTIDSLGTTIEEVKNIKFRDIPVQPLTIAKVRPFNIGLVVEAGLEYAISDNTVLVGGLFFNAGFLDMFKDSDSERVVSRSIGLRVSVLF
ncbi:MAG: porin family protein [Chitinophagales bacterium]